MEQLPQPPWRPFDLFYIIDSVKTDRDIDHTKFDVKFHKWTIDVFRKLNAFNLLPTYKSILLDVDPRDNSIRVPNDYIEYTKIGLVSNGKILNLSLNDNISIAQQRYNCCLEAVTELNFNSNAEMGVPFYSTISWYDWQWYYLPSFHNGQFVAGRYGQGEGFYRGGYREDKANRRIVFDQFLKFPTVCLEYKSSGGIITGNTYLPENAIAPMVNGVHRERCKHSKDPAEHADFALYNREFSRSVKLLAAQEAGLTAGQILDIFRSSIHQLPKR